VKGRIVKATVIWLVTVFLALVCLRSGLTKLPGDSYWIRDFHRWNYPDWLRIAVAIVELAACLLLLIRRVASVGAALFIAVMLGAIYTHATHAEMSRLPFNVLLGTLSLFILVARARRVSLKS
jgi:uncharacterized membrane protein YphA (DoxX/SURF4 family)